MRTISWILLFGLAGGGQANTLTQAEIEDGWILLFDGETLFGWASEGEAQWRVEGGAIVASQGGSGWLRSRSTFADYVLKCEFRTSEQGNSGIFLRSAREGQPHVTGYELQIWNHHPKFPTGSLVNHAATTKGKLKPDAWNTFEVEAQGDRYQVKLNGAAVLEAREAKTKLGHIGLQYNKDNKIEFRNIRLKPLGLQPIFNGKDLAGWRKVATERAKVPAEWSVRGGMLHVEKGPGQLETEWQWEDFVLQLGVRTNAQGPDHHPNSGVFLRGDANGFWTGYESQIRNEYKDGDRTKAVDFGTGGVYRNQAARRIVANDNEFFVKTIVARGRYIGVWVNGYQVSDWEDTNPEGKSVRNKEARLSAGCISLQAHDPTTNLDFKNIRIVTLPR